MKALTSAWAGLRAKFKRNVVPAEQQRLTTWVPAGHFYSPIVDPEDPFVRRKVNEFFEDEHLLDASVRINEEKHRETLRTLAENYPHLAFGIERNSSDLYFYDNPRFAFSDGVTLALIIYQFRPARIVEIGSGYSSCLMFDLRRQGVIPDTTLTFIEPFPELLRSLVPETTLEKARLLEQPVQAVDLAVFELLGSQDILFVDSTHVAKTGSDVNYIFFEVLPRLQVGVLIHFHDIFYPFEYLPTWIQEENRSWNEAYLLHAFLQFNDHFEVLFFNDYAWRFLRPELETLMPLFLRGRGGSIWIRKIRS